jgi:hypothetical protein
VIPATPHIFLRRILVVANEAAEGEALRRSLLERTADAPADVLVLAPASKSPAGSDVEMRLLRCVDWLACHGLVSVRARVGDSDPMLAIADALAGFHATELIVATHPPERSNWLARDLPGRARRMFGLPTTHVVVDDTGGRGALALAA